VARSVVALLLLSAVPSLTQTTVRVRLKPAVDSAIIEMPLEDYVAAVVAGEAGTLHSTEALRAMAVAARTYAIHFRGRHRDEGYDLCGTTHCQRAEPAMVNARIEAAARATEGELLWYRGSVARALYSRDCGGMTEDDDVPYLRRHPDPYCTRGAPHSWRWSAPAPEIAAALTRSGLRVPRDLAAIGIARRTGSGRVREAALTGGGESVRIAAESLRLAVGRALGFATIRSDWWEANAAGGRIEFTGRGEGHGVGLCQLGADAMGAEGKSWREILAFYYPGTEAGKTGRGLKWTRLSGETVALFSTQPEQDRIVLMLAERQAREAQTRTGWPAPRGIELRVYPDLATFRDATAEPGWVAAHTSGRRIDLQPAAVLRARDVLDSTLRHEMLHVFIESRAVPGLPLWFREGLVEYLNGGVAAGHEGSDDGIADRGDEAQARAANRAAAARVANLVARNGLTAVLGWVSSGLPK
jgi:stage II sporulation protein D (peptidoglycan lytic transglycosylase)